MLCRCACKASAHLVGCYVQAVLVRISARLLKKTLLRTDERAKLEGELLDGIDVVKCMTWEVSFRPPLLHSLCIPLHSCCAHFIRMAVDFHFVPYGRLCPYKC